MIRNAVFNEVEVKDKLVLWIRNWFEDNGSGCKAVVGISGGKDSSVVAALCKEALGKDRVLGVLMPNGVQPDIDVSLELVKFLNIDYLVIDVGETINSVKLRVNEALGEFTVLSNTNLPPRIRMATLYAVSQSVNGRVANTCNLSEDWVGYSTRYGDMAGDFSPLGQLTVREVKAVGRALGLPSMFVDKVPIDGLQPKTDEENLGFTYDVLDEYIRTGNIEDMAIKEKIDGMHRDSRFKFNPIQVFEADV